MNNLIKTQTQTPFIHITYITQQLEKIKVYIFTSILFSQIGNICDIGDIPKINIYRYWNDTNDFTRLLPSHLGYDFIIIKAILINFLYFS